MIEPNNQFSEDKMSLDLSYECLLSEDDLLGQLGLSQVELNKLEAMGLPFLNTGKSHLYLASCLVDFFKKVQCGVL